jgi:energy-coupling factor transporter ATP-binding protein EcfA2
MSLLEKLVSLMRKKIFISTHDIPLIAQCANSFVLFSDADEWMVTEDKEKILEWQLSQR